MPHTTAPARSRALTTTGTLMNAVRALSRVTSLHEVIGVVIRAARIAAHADGATFIIREDDLCYYVDEDAIGPLWKGRRFPMDTCVSGWSMHHRLAVAIPDIETDARVPTELYRKTFVRSLVMVPIRTAAPIGAIGVYWAEAREILPETIHCMQTLADATGGAVESVLANAEGERIATENPRIPVETVRPEVVRMCAWTRRIHHEGKWLSIEAFLRTRFGLLVSHGIAEDVVESLAHELDDEFKSSQPWLPG